VDSDTLSALAGMAPAVGGIVLVVLYLGYYLADPALPGNNHAYPLGWWGWWDQSQYIASARALRALDFSPGLNWFPLGYSLLAAPFTGWLPMHPFFFVDLAALLIAYAAFLLFARELDVASPWSAAIFVLTAMGDPRLARTWAEPWNTTVSAALIWTLLAVAALQLAAPAPDRNRQRTVRLAVLGVLLAALPLVRPTDALFSVICGCVVAGNEAWRRQLRLRDTAVVLLAGSAMVLPYGLLYLRIYGWHESAYVVVSQKLGFVFSQLPWKAYVLLVDPHPWFPYGVGLLGRCPWIALAIAGVVPATMGLRGHARLSLGLFVACMLAYVTLFFSFIDLLPSGLWRYENVHYFKWCFPGLGLFAWFLLRELFAGRRRIAVASLVVTVLALSIRIAAVPVGGEGPARMVQFPGLRIPWAQSYFNTTAALKDSRGELASINGIRILPDSDGVRVIALRREFVGPVAWVQGKAPSPQAYQIAPRRWGEHVTFGYPCWLPPYPCDHLSPRP
jgi:hypothetical protein